MANPESVPSTLTAELVERLAWLASQPHGVAEVALSALPYGSRASLIGHEIIKPVPTTGDAPVEITITDHGWRVIQNAAELHGDSDRDERERREAESELERAYADWKDGMAARRDSSALQNSRNGAQWRTRVLAVAAAGAAGFAGGGAAGAAAERLLVEKRRRVAISTIALEFLANSASASKRARRSMAKRRIRTLIVALAIVVATAFVFSEKLRKRALDALFAAEEEFQYTPPPPTAAELSTAASGHEMTSR